MRLTFDIWLPATDGAGADRRVARAGRSGDPRLRRPGPGRRRGHAARAGARSTSVDARAGAGVSRKATATVQAESCRSGSRRADRSGCWRRPHASSGRLLCFSCWPSAATPPTSCSRVRARANGKWASGCRWARALAHRQLLLTENLVLALRGRGARRRDRRLGNARLSSMPPMRVRGIPISFETAVDATVAGLRAAARRRLRPDLRAHRRCSSRAWTRRRRSAPAAARRRAAALRNTLMAVEVALAVVVLLVAGTLPAGFIADASEDPGFRRDGVLLAEYDLTRPSVDEAATSAFTATLLDQLRALPGVASAAIATSVPLDIHGLPTRFFRVEGARGTMMLSTRRWPTPSRRDIST